MVISYFLRIYLHTIHVKHAGKTNWRIEGIRASDCWGRAKHARWNIINEI